MSISFIPLLTYTCLCLTNVVVAAPFMTAGLKQSLLKTKNETAESNSSSWNPLEDTKLHNATESSLNPEVVDVWSVMWYLGAFGGLVTFFLVVTCSEWCFGNHMYTRHGINELYINAYQSNFHESRRISETPPPPYDLFAPPSYSELFGKVQEPKKNTINVFIIPIHRRQSSPAS